MFYRDEVVLMMTNLIDNMNKQIMINAGIQSEMIDQNLNEMRPDLMRVNGLLYDMLKENGVIA